MLRAGQFRSETGNIEDCLGHLPLSFPASFDLVARELLNYAGQGREGKRRLRHLSKITPVLKRSWSTRGPLRCSFRWAKIEGYALFKYVPDLNKEGRKRSDGVYCIAKVQVRGSHLRNNFVAMIG